MIIGYARVSTANQNLDRQIDALISAGADKLFTEKVTGRKKSPGVYEADGPTQGR